MRLLFVASVMDCKSDIFVWHTRAVIFCNSEQWLSATHVVGSNTYIDRVHFSRS